MCTIHARMIRTYKTGVEREQPSLLPPCIDDYVGRDNMVRAIDCYVGTLDLAKLGFVLAGCDGGPGQPPYHPGDLLKLYLYGYLQRIRSSRALDREARRNLEVIWLLRGLSPRYRTIAGFRKDNWAALKAVNRDFVVLTRQAGLVGGEVVAIDGAFFDGNASKGSIKTRRKLDEQLAAIDEEIEAYGAAVDANDTAEAEAAPAQRDGEAGAGEDLGQKMAALLAKRGRLQAEVARLDERGETQLSRTDADARILSKRGQVVAGYNVQIVVDDKHKLIVASEVVNDGNDTGQLHPMAKAAKEELGVETLSALADTGYYNGQALKACEEDAIVAYVPQAKRTGRLEAQERISHEAFVYDREADVYRCPADQLLRPTEGRKVNTGGRVATLASASPPKMNFLPSLNSETRGTGLPCGERIGFRKGSIRGTLATASGTDPKKRSICALPSVAEFAIEAGYFVRSWRRPNTPAREALHVIARRRLAPKRSRVQAADSWIASRR